LAEKGLMAISDENEPCGAYNNSKKQEEEGKWKEGGMDCARWMERKSV
jgi:hypothetical protein